MGYENKKPHSEYDPLESSNSPIDEALKLDYEQTIGFIKTLIDTRYKLIALVPTLTAAGVALLTGSINQAANIDPTLSLGLGLLGFFVTLGILFNELRNTVFYVSATTRARRLERALHLPCFYETRGPGLGGLFNELPRGQRFAGVALWSDRAVALVYGSALGGWAYIIVNAILKVINTVLDLSSTTTSIISMTLAAITAGLIIWAALRASRIKS